MIFAIGAKRDDPSAAQRAPPGFTRRALIQSNPLGFAFAFADPNAINAFENFALRMPIGFAQREVQRMSMAVNHPVAFET